MPVYRIAELLVQMSPQYSTLSRQGREYRVTDESRADFSIELSQDFIRRVQRKYPHLTHNDCEYIWTGVCFYQRLLDYEGMLLHASAVYYEDGVYLLSGGCGVGKSTQAGLWQEYFGRDRVLIINDDKPAIRRVNQELMVYGTPFSGKTNLQRNISAPIQGICFLERSRQGWIERATPKEALGLLLSQTVRPKTLAALDMTMSLLEQILREIPIFKMGCTLEVEGVRMAYQAMNKN